MPRMPATAQLRSQAIKLGRRYLGIRQLNHLVRFEPILRHLLEANPEGKAMTVLDVGAGSAGVTTLLPAEWRSTALDADFADYSQEGRRVTLHADQVLGDVRDLQFADNSFDAVVALDVLEHLSPGDRTQAVREICRVARARAVIACPAGEAALEGDRRLAARFEAHGLECPGWLAEHLENGFPEADELAAAASDYGQVRVEGNENIHAHERLIYAEHQPLPAVALRLICRPLEWLLRSHRPQARRLAQRLLAIARGQDRAPAYRCVLVVDRSPLSAPANPQTSA